MTAPQMLVLVISALHLQCLPTKYLFVATNSNDRSGSIITKEHLDRLKHFAPRIKNSNKALNPTDKVCTMSMYYIILYAINSSPLI